jgi:hypothetical protein
MEPRIALKFLRPVRNFHCAIIILANAQLGQVDGNLKWELGGGGANSEPSQRQKGQHRSQERKSMGMDQSRPCLTLALRLLA